MRIIVKIVNEVHRESIKMTMCSETTCHSYSDESWNAAIRFAKEYSKHRIDDGEIWIKQNDEKEIVFSIIKLQDKL